jgi:hypothetical protein
MCYTIAALTKPTKETNAYYLRPVNCDNELFLSVNNLFQDKKW